MLYLIGLGLYDENDLSLRGYDALRTADHVFVDRYTHIIDESVLQRLESRIGRSIVCLGRTALESETQVLEHAGTSSVALIVGGDPLVATTHISLLETCMQKNIPYKIIHSSSILSAAIGESGLQTYKFGRSVTLTFWYDNYRPTTPYKVISENRAAGLHTMVFIDLNGQEPMDFATIKDIFRKMELAEKGSLLDDMHAVVLSRIGYPDQKVAYGRLLDIADAGHPPFIMIVPGKLHFLEEDWLSHFKQ